MTEAETLIPPLRAEIVFQRASVDTMICVYDPKKYVSEDFELPTTYLSILPYFDGNLKVSDVPEDVLALFKPASLASIISHIDEACLLKSEAFEKKAIKQDRQFENETVLKANYAGSAYPMSEGELKALFNSSKHEVVPSTKSSSLPTFLFAPHIDFRVETALYKTAFQSLPKNKFSRVLVIGTSHYAGYYPNTYQDNPFICSAKDFQSSLGTIKSASDWVEKLANASCEDTLGVTFQDRAFKSEHSIEFHLIMSQLYLEKGFDYFPILVDSLQEMMYLSESEQAKRLGKLCNVLRNLIEEYPNPEEILVLVSGDLAHVGPRFGDAYDANEQRDAILAFDQEFLEVVANLDFEKLLSLYKTKHDMFNHCGFPPALVALKLLSSKFSQEGVILGREQWYEEEDQSMVSYGAALVTS
jgi:AmmeMemoRadiSam system protein B